MKKYQIELLEIKKNIIIELKYIKIEAINLDLPKITHLLCDGYRTQAVLGKNNACNLFTLLYLNGQMSEQWGIPIYKVSSQSFDLTLTNIESLTIKFT